MIGMLKFLPWAALAAVLSGVGGVFYGIEVGQDRQIAAQAKTDAAIAEDREQTRQIVAGEVAKIRVVNQTNETVLEREIVKVPDFSKCRAGPDALRVLNDQIAGTATDPGPVGGGVVPDADPTD